MRRLELGRVMATPAALEALAEARMAPSELLGRHAAGDWGELDAGDRRENRRSLEHGLRVLSSYPLPGHHGAKVWVLTGADRSATTILMPSDY